MAKTRRKSLAAYEQKRDFSQTPEPRDQPTRRSAQAAQPVFVIHRHEARRLHFDLRLEWQGVLQSWAVPKLFSYDPTVKRLAVRTEDHPLSYEAFEGVIPAGQYGAGTMMIWDRGSYTLLGPGTWPECLEQGKLELLFFGGRMRGEWHMVRLATGKDEWLIFKGRDRYARGREDPVLSLDLARRPRRPFPRRSPPMQASRGRRRFTDPEWLYELKLEGLRVRVEIEPERTRIRDRRGRDQIRHLSKIRDELRRVRAERTVMDGVLVCLDDAQRPSDERLDELLQGVTSRDPQLYLFDLLYFEDWDLRPFPLGERKAALATLLPDSRHVFYMDHERGRAAELLELVAEAGLPGVIAKRSGSPYVSGESSDWVEFRCKPKRRADPLDLRSALKEARHQPRPSGRNVRFTNRSKILWPQDGYTKGDLIDYYDQVADELLPYLKDRPLSLNRFPNGIDGESFYQKHLPATVPDWVPIVEIASQKRNQRIRYVLCSNRDTLLYLANLASIDLHPWLSRQGSLAHPDWAVLDLDPLRAPFQHVVTVARALGKLLVGIGMRPYLKTSGSKGLHIYVPLAAGYSYDQSRMFCEGVARVVAGQHAEIATVERSKGLRSGKVYIDYMQNRRGQTVVAPYVVRPLNGAPVSAPLDWDELSSDLQPGKFTIHTLPGRVQQSGDLFARTLTDAQELSGPIDELRRLLGGSADPPP